MSTSTTSAAIQQPALRLHAAFCAVVLPAVERHARFVFRNLKCADRRDDKVQETVAVAWQWFLGLAERGKDATAFPGALAVNAARHVRWGRTLCGQPNSSKDALSPVAQQRREFTVAKLPDYSTLDSSPLQEALIDNTVSPVPDQAAFRIDFPNWLATLSSRNRDITEAMAMRFGTGQLARRFGVTPARVSQLRREFSDSWDRFHKEDD